MGVETIHASSGEVLERQPPPFRRADGRRGAARRSSRPSGGSARGRARSSSLPGGRTGAPGRPRRTSASRRPRAGSASRIPSSTCGWRSWKAATARGTTVAPALWKQTSLRRPPRRPAIAARSSSADSRRAMIASACPTRTEPASVSRTPRGSRSTSCVPVSRSSAATCWLTRGLGEVERLRGGGERALRRDLAEHLHAAYVEHQHSLSACQATFIGTNGCHLRS